jgi:glutathione S-transferase
MKLINATPSPYGRKVAIALKEKGIDYEVQYDIPWHEGTCVDQFSPFQQLPILITNDNEYIYDSTFILEWLERYYPEPGLLPTSVDDLIAAKRLQMFGERLLEIAAIIVFETPRAEVSKPWVARQTRKLDTGIAELSRLIGNRKPSSSSPITLGDITVVSTLTMFEFMVEQNIMPYMSEADWRKRFTNLVEYVEALESRPSFIETRPVMMAVNLKEVVA